MYSFTRAGHYDDESGHEYDLVRCVKSKFADVAVTNTPRAGEEPGARDRAQIAALAEASGPEWLPWPPAPWKSHDGDPMIFIKRKDGVIDGPAPRSIYWDVWGKNGFVESHEFAPRFWRFARVGELTPELPFPVPEPSFAAIDGYAPLARVLEDAFEQSASGKGNERHANGKAFLDQPIMEIARRHGIGFQLGQIDKKTDEANGMIKRGEHDAAIREMLGVIVYAAASVLLINEMKERGE